MTDKLHFDATTACRLNDQLNTFMRIQLLKKLCTLCLGAALFSACLSARAQIQVGASGSTLDPFNSIPAATSWSTKNLPGASGEPEIDGSMDDFVNGSTNAASTISAQVSNVTGNPPAAAASAMWTPGSANGYLVTRPTGNAVTLMMATLTNLTGAVVNSFHVNYVYEQKLAGTLIANEAIKGHRVYYSVSGSAGSWVPIGDFGNSFTTNVVQNIDIAVNVASTPWSPNTKMYILFADDNSLPNADGANSIDNFFVTNVVAVAAPSITVQPQGSTNAPNSTVVLNVTAVGAAPLYYQWFKNSNAITSFTTNSAFTILSAQPTDQGFYSVTVSNTSGVVKSTNVYVAVICSAAAVIVSPPTGQTLNSGDTLNLTVTASGTAPFTYQWFRNYVAIPDATNATYSKPSVQPSDSGYYAVLVNNCVGTPASSANALVSISDAPYTLFGLTNKLWKYNQANVDLGTDWRAVGYDDTVAGWSQGRGILAFETDAAGILALTNTVLNLSNGTVRIPTYYFRTHFTLTNDPALVTLITSNYFDDGAVVYLNGEQAFRVNIANNPGFNTLATAAGPAPEGTFTNLTLPRNLLVQGDNVLAVEVHQSSLTSSDIDFGMELRVISQPPVPLLITNQPQNVTARETTPAVLSVGVLGQPAFYQWYRNGVAVSNGTFNPLTIPIVTTNDAGNYFVVVTNVINSITSSVAILTVTADTNPPVILEADGTANLTNVLVTFSDLIQVTNATNIANFKITNAITGTLLGITKAVLQNGSNVLLTTSARTFGDNYILVVNNIRDISPRANLILSNSSYPVRMLASLLPLNFTPWAYYDPFPPGLDNPDLGTVWKEFSYNYSISGGGSWIFDGQSIFYDTVETDTVPGPLGTPLSPTTAVTAYFRNGFNLRASPGGLRLLLTHVIDDAGVLYLNGNEVFRTNLPAGTITYTNRAISTIDAPDRIGPFAIPNNFLRQGSNVIAAELHQVAVTDIDRIFGMQLDASVQSFVTGNVFLVGGTEDISTVENSSATFTVLQTGGLTFQWKQNGTNLVGATNDTYTIPSVSTNMNGFTYQVAVSNASGSGVLSTNGTLRILGDTTPPTVISAVLRTNNTILLAFSERLAAASAMNTANYAVTNATGAGATVTSAVLTNGTNVVLSFGVQLAGSYVVVMNNITDAASNPNPIAPNTAIRVGGDFPAIIAMGAPWKYLLIVTNADVQTNFMKVSYNDSSWSGPSNALLYVEDAALANLPATKTTPLSLYDLNFPTNQNRINTFYFRQKTVLPTAGPVATLRIRHVIDDGMVLHLNGVEVYRNNMPAGVITAASQAPNNIGDAGLLGPFEVTVTNLVGGTNVFAVEVHQNGPTSSDVVMGIEIGVSVPSVLVQAQQPVQITGQPQSRTNAVGSVALFSVGASGTAPFSYQWRKNGTNIANANDSVFALLSAQCPDGAGFSVVVGDVFGSVTSVVATLTVTNCSVGCSPVTPAQPTLTIRRSGTNYILTWPSSPVATNSCGSNAVFTLQRTLYLSNPPSATVWSNITTASPYTNGVPTNAVPVPFGAGFFRLKLP